MENKNFVEKLATLFGQNASVQKVYGEPILAGNKTIIPVAKIVYGLGGGSGQGIKSKKNGPKNVLPEKTEEPIGEGSGGGGGMYAQPVGVYEVSECGTRFIPVNNHKKLFIQLAICFLITGWINKKITKKYLNSKN